MKKTLLLMAMIAAGSMAFAQTTCTSNGGNKWSTGFNCSGSGSPVVYEIQAGDSVYLNVFANSIDTLKVYGILEFKGGKKITLNRYGIVQVFSGGSVKGGTINSTIRFSHAAPVPGPYNVSGPAYTIGGTWILGFVPVTWMGVELDNGQLTWSTGTEENNSHFEVEVSHDGMNWMTDQIVASKADGGTSYEITEYSTRINADLGKRAFVRIKQVDFDGAFTYSKVLAYTQVEDQIDLQQLQPLELTVSKEGEPMEVRLLTLLGTEISQASTEAGSITLQVPSSGVYLLEVKTLSGVSYIKQYVR